MNIGPRVVDAPADVNHNAILQPAARGATTGRNRARRLAGADFGTSGGASSVMAPSGTSGAGSRGSREKSTFWRTRHMSVAFHPQPAKLPHSHVRTPQYRECAGVKRGVMRCLIHCAE